MATLFRSVPMELVQLYMQDDAVHETVDRLGAVGVLQFRDVSKRFHQRDFEEFHCTFRLRGAFSHTLSLSCLLQLNAESSTFQRPFVNDIRRCEELERKLRFFEKEVRSPLVCP